MENGSIFFVKLTISEMSVSYIMLCCVGSLIRSECSIYDGNQGWVLIFMKCDEKLIK